MPSPSVFQRLSLGYAVLAAMLIVSTAAAAWNLSRAHDSLHRIRTVDLQLLLQAAGTRSLSAEPGADPGRLADKSRHDAQNLGETGAPAPLQATRRASSESFGLGSEALKSRLDQLHKQTVAMGSMILLLSMACLALTGLIFYGANRQIVRPVQALRRASHRLNRGESIEPDRLGLTAEFKELSLALASVNQRIEELEGLKADFVARVSHDMHSPLTSIREAVALLRDPSLGQLNDRQRTLLSIVHEESDRQLAHVASLIELTRLESGQAPLHHDFHALPSLLKRSLSAVSSQAAKKPVRLHLDCPIDLPLVRIDWPLLDRALVNILGSALRHTPDGHELMIMARAATHDQSDRTPDGVRISIFDPAIFDSCTDLPDLNRTIDKLRGSGSGLMLALARQVFHIHGGSIRADYRPESGARFMLWLPAVSAEYAASLLFEEPTKTKPSRDAS
jgi:signal transduction histidine kinase